MRLTEREMAAWCVVRGIDYVVEECPMAVGNKHLSYKDALNLLDNTSPERASFYLGFLDRMRPLLEHASITAPGSCPLAVHHRQQVPRPAHSVGLSRRHRVMSRFVRMVLNKKARKLFDAQWGSPWRLTTIHLRRAGAAARQKAATVLGRTRRGGEFHSHAGFVPHADIVEAVEGTVLRSTHGRVHRAEADP